MPAILIAAINRHVGTALIAKPSHPQVNGRLLVGLLGTSPLKPSEVALLDVGSVDELIASTPEQWQALQQSSRAQVRLMPVKTPALS